MEQQRESTNIYTIDFLKYFPIETFFETKQTKNAKG